MYKEKFRHLPEYYPTMYLDGYTPEEILWAKHQQMYKNLVEKEPTIKIES